MATGNPAQLTTVADIAARLGGTVEGDGALPITGLAGLREAEPGDITFLSSIRYTEAMRHTRASAVLVAADWDGEAPCAVIRVADPGQAAGELAGAFAPPPVAPAAGIHPTAVVAGDAVLGEDVCIGPHGVVEAGARVGARTVLHALCRVGPSVTVGADCVLHAHVSIREHCRIGDRVVIHDGTVIGSDGFGYDRREDKSWRKVPQVGIVEIGNDVEIGANVTIDRARFGRTRIEDGVKLDNLIQIAHNCRIGENTAIAALAGIAGSTIVGRNVQIGGQSTSVGHVTVGDDAIVAGKCTVVKDVPPGSFMMGYVAMPRKRFGRVQAAHRRLPELVQKVRELEKAVAELKKQIGSGE